jgi:serine/threonine-protein kinase HipA
MPYKPVEVIEVRCWGSRVGAVAIDERTGFYAFEYERQWKSSGVELAPTTMPTSDPSQLFIFPTLSPTTFHRLPSMIADSLPDDFGNALTTAYLANAGVDPRNITALDRLAYLGTRGVGALEFHPLRGPRTRKATAVELSELVVAARSAIADDVTSPRGMTSAISHLIAVGTSAGGARAKAVVALNLSTGELRSGQVPGDPGFEQWLLKFDGIGAGLDLGQSSSYGRIEYGYYLMALEAGITMSESRLWEEGARAHFMTRRFDRTNDGRKIHTQTLCALAELDFRQIGAHDYSQLFILLDQLGLGPQVRAETFRRMVFNVASANCDDHTKNFSFLLAEGGEWELSPAYDVTHAFSSTSKWTQQHLMAVNGRTSGIARTDLLMVADRFEVPGAKTIIDQVLDAVSRWPDFAADVEVPHDLGESIRRDTQKWSAPLR